MKRHSLVTAAFVCATTLGLCGCSVPGHGLVGFSRNSAGLVEAVVQMCDEHVDGITVYLDDESIVAEVSTEAPVSDFATIDLGSDFESKMKGDAEASSYGWSYDSSSSADGPTLTRENVLGLVPDQILSVDPTGEPTDIPGKENASFDLAEFKEAAASHCT